MTPDTSIEAIVEISPVLSRHAQRARLRWAYRRSRKGLVVLVLNEIGFRQVDQLLDPIVAEEGNGVHGVLFMDVKESNSLIEAARNARKILLASGDFGPKWRGLRSEEFVRGLPMAEERHQ